MRTIDEIIIHCSATRPSWMAGAGVEAQRDEIRRWHVDDNRWSDIGYHEIGGRNGMNAAGRDRDHDGDIWEEIGAHVRGRNATTLSYCLIGGHGSKESDRFLDHFTQAQEDALIAWILARQAEFPTITQVSGHNEYAAKACPGFRVKSWWEGVTSRRALARAAALDEIASLRGASSGPASVAALAGPWPEAAPILHPEPAPILTDADYERIARLAVPHVLRRQAEITLSILNEET